jgi:hypothetical protein
MHALDPLFARIADLWMKTLIEDFGTDHWSVCMCVCARAYIYIYIYMYLCLYMYV